MNQLKDYSTVKSNYYDTETLPLDTLVSLFPEGSKVTLGDWEDGYRNGCRTSIIKAYGEIPELKSRNEKHFRALNLGDIKPGITIQRIDTSGDKNFRPGHVIEGPYLRYEVSKVSDSHEFAEFNKTYYKEQTLDWVVLVQMDNGFGDILEREWYLGDMGVCPYARSTLQGYEDWIGGYYTLLVQ